MKLGKATGPDSISVELVGALEDYEIHKITTLINEIYRTGQIPPNISKRIFIALINKTGAIECKLHRTISFMSHNTKIFF